jgi:hypothetical protein
MKSTPTRTSPNRHLVALFTFIALLPLVHYVPPWITQNISQNRLVVTVLAVAIIVPVISYLMLPAMFRLLRIIKG